MGLQTPVTVKPSVPAKSDISASFNVKVATSNLFILDEKQEQSDFMADAIIEDIGGQEIINLTRNDLLTGEDVSYSILSNLAETSQRFNPNSLIKMQGVDSDFFNSFPYTLNNYSSQVGTGKDSTGALTGDVAYVDFETGEVVINVTNVARDQRVEVEFLVYEDLIKTSWT